MTLAARFIADKTVRQLMAADGYLQLGLPAAALAELDRVEGCGPLESARDYLAGQALMADDRHEDALEPLTRAAETIPAPWNRAAYESLSECFRATGRDALAEVTDLWGDDDGIPPGFDPDAGLERDADPAEVAAESFEAGAGLSDTDLSDEGSWGAAEDFGDAADLSADHHAGTGPTLWGGDGFGGAADLLSDEGQTGDFAADADAMEPGRPREWDACNFDNGFGTDPFSDGPCSDGKGPDLPPHSR